MLPFQKDIREFLTLLNEHEVRYLLVGGYSVAFHGYPRYTKDIDLFVSTSPQDGDRLERVLSDFGMASLGLKAGDFADKNVVVQIDYPPARIDIMTTVEAIDFEEAWSKRITAEVEGVLVQIVDKESLIANKLAVARDQDLVDAKKLRARQ